MKISEGNMVEFECPFAIKQGKIISIEKGEYKIQTDISVWIVKSDKIIRKIENE